MAGEIKATFFFESKDAARPVGWTETLYKRGIGGSLLDAMPGADDLGRKRAAMLGAGYQISYIRLSKQGIFRDSRLSDATPFPGPPPVSDEAKLGDFAQSSLLVRMESDDLNRRFMWVSGLPDGITHISHLPDDPAWLTAFLRWNALLITQWAFFGSVKGADGHSVEPKQMQLYNINRVFMDEYSSRKRGRPFKLYRGRLPKEKEPVPPPP